MQQRQDNYTCVGGWTRGVGGGSLSGGVSVFVAADLVVWMCMGRQGSARRHCTALCLWLIGGVHEALCQVL